MTPVSVNLVTVSSNSMLVALSDLGDQREDVRRDRGQSGDEDLEEHSKKVAFENRDEKEDQIVNQ